MAKQQRTKTTNAETQTVLERTGVTFDQTIPLEEMEAKFAEVPAQPAATVETPAEPVAVTYENIEQVLAEAPKITSAQRMKEPAEPWEVSTVAHRLRQCTNFLNSYGVLSSDETRRIKDEIDRLSTI